MDPRFSIRSTSSRASLVSTTSQRSFINNESNRETRFILNGPAGSTPKTLTINVIRDAVKNAKDMHLAHEIIMDSEFQMLSHSDPPQSSLAIRIKTTMNDTFWENLREQLNSKPPLYGRLITVLSYIKENFNFVIPDHKQRTLAIIYEKLDEKSLREETKLLEINLKSITSRIIKWMAELCTPMRSDDVNDLFDIDDVVVTFRRILEVMDLMKSDRSNVILDSVRREVFTFAVEYEKRNFVNLLQTKQGDFPATEAWLLRNKRTNSNDSPSTSSILNGAYLELLDWNPKHKYPEIMTLDQRRMQKFTAQALQLCCTASVLAIASRVPAIKRNTTNRETVLSQVTPLFGNVSNDKDVTRTIENVWMKVKPIIISKLHENKKTLTKDSENTLKLQILSLNNKDAAIRKLMWSHLLTYMRLVQVNRMSLPPVPPEYVDIRDELKALANTFKRVTEYNYSVFGDYCEKRLNELSTQPN